MFCGHIEQQKQRTQLNLKAVSPIMTFGETKKQLTSPPCCTRHLHTRNLLLEDMSELLEVVCVTSSCTVTQNKPKEKHINSPIYRQRETLVHMDFSCGK